jgi:hypothetical protein
MLVNILFSHLLSKNIRINMYKTIILHVVFYRNENFFFTLREEHRLILFENSAEENIWILGGSNRSLEKTE